MMLFTTEQIAARTPETIGFPGGKVALLQTAKERFRKTQGRNREVSAINVHHLSCGG